MVGGGSSLLVLVMMAGSWICMAHCSSLQTSTVSSSNSSLSYFQPGLPVCNRTENATCVSECGNGFWDRENEGCDDGNLLPSDGCNELCEVEEGSWVCLTGGAPCSDASRCKEGELPDCRGVCGGLSIVDECGQCTGYGTGKPPGWAKDHCDICFGNNSAKDACGLCFGGDRFLDACGVCWGDNSTCKDCAGVLYGTAYYDVYGLCTPLIPTPRFLECDDIPFPLGGHFVDNCGVCGGENWDRNCPRGCNNDNVTSIYDCDGVCNGPAYLDDCGVCVGGSTGRQPNVHLSVGGACFVPQACGGSVDACGICGGDNSTCEGTCPVLGPLAPVHLGGLNYDICGICGGNHTECRFDAEGILDGQIFHNCLGDLNNNWIIDLCGMCVPNSGTPSLVAFKNTCGVCFGGGDNRDQCGCWQAGAGSRIDDCNQCNGNQDKDECGECFLNNQARDDCGVCFGDSLSCAGCDFVPNSTMTVDECGVCGGDGSSCAAPITSPPGAKGFRISLQVGVAIGAVFLFLVALSVAFVVTYYKRRKSIAVTIYNEERTKTLARAPVGEVTLVFTDIQDSTKMWETYPTLMERTIEIHHDICRTLIQTFNGYEVKTEGDAFMIAFHTQIDAVNWMMAAQLAFLNENRIHPEVMKFINCQEVRSKTGKLIWRGLRVRMGAHTGLPTCQADPNTMIMDYHGTMVNRSARVEGAAHGGQVLISDEVYQCIRVFLDSPECNYVVKDMGEFQFKGIKSLMHVHQILPKELAEREFPPIKSYVKPETTTAKANLYPTLGHVEWDPSQYDFSNYVEDPTDPESYGIDDHNDRLATMKRAVRPDKVPRLEYLPCRS